MPVQLLLRRPDLLAASNYAYHPDPEAPPKTDQHTADLTGRRGADDRARVEVPRSFHESPGAERVDQCHRTLLVADIRRQRKTRQGWSDRILRPGAVALLARQLRRPSCLLLPGTQA